MKFLLLQGKGFIRNNENDGRMRDSIEVQLSVKKREKRSQDFARSIFTILDSLILAAAEILRDFAITPERPSVN